ncbi:outer membrane protein [Hoeflea sp. TYP-13]|uniref:outer membrane protein n=1 Tax=Hoeflea sp. TYP-13 TaxID=3230023 RepID=UPI0034C5CC28
MIKNVVSHSLIAALLLGGSNAALAADLDNIIYAPQLPRMQPVEVGNGWYLRGDVGYDFSTDGSATSFQNFDVALTTYTTQAYATSSFDTDVSVGAGFGYQFNDWLRGEAMVSYQNGSFNATSSSTTLPCTGLATGTGCNTSGSADFNAYGFMANGYIDLGTYIGFQPYVGAGAGYTLMDYDNYNSTETCVGGGCASTTPFTVAHSGERSWRFTYAFMAGFAYEFMRNLKADLGYKYTNVDGGDTYGFDATSAAAGASGIQGTDNGFSTHQVKASLRYALW